MGLVQNLLAQSQGRLSLIRDAEIENTLRVFAAPIFKAADLDFKSVQMHIVNDNTLNAFVTKGQHIFFNTGLLIKAENAGQVMGVIAHETGHITAGHLVRMHQNLAIKICLSPGFSWDSACHCRWHTRCFASQSTVCSQNRHTVCF